MKIYIGTDHAGYVLKEKLVSSLKGEGYEVIDKGAFEYDENDDYPDFVVPVAKQFPKIQTDQKELFWAAQEKEKRLPQINFLMSGPLLIMENQRRSWTMNQI